LRERDGGNFLFFLVFLSFLKNKKEKGTTTTTTPTHQGKEKGKQKSLLLLSC